MWKVVIVEDEDLLRNGLIQAIPWQEMGFEVVGDTDNGKKGLELIREKNPQVVFTDIRMAQMDGLTMAEKVAEWNPDIRLVFVSGYDEFSYAMRALKVGAVEYILKPIRLEEVKATLRKLAGLLEEERSRRQDYDKLKKLEEYNAGQMRQELYRSVIYDSELIGKETGGESQAVSREALERFFEVLIVERGDFASVSMGTDYIGMMEQDHAFEGMVKAAFGEELEYTMIRGSACERILVFSNREEEALLETLRQVQALSGKWELEAAKAEGTAPFFQMDSGTVGYGREGLHQSYQDARKAGQRRYQEEWKRFFAGRGEPAEGGSFISYDREPLLEAVRSGSREQIETEYAKLEEELGNQKIFSHMHLILIVTSIFEGLSKLPEEIGRIPETSGNPMEEYQRIISSGKRSEMLAGLKEYCLMLGDCFGETKETRMQSSLKRAVGYMQQEYGNEQLMLADVARHAYISSSYLSMILKKETGKTFIEYLTDIRMEHAKRLLLETEMKNYEVAQACGFANATYFSTVFKSVTGLSPSAWRREAEIKD